jgi:hypothetical protein
MAIGFWWIWFCIFFSGYALVYAIVHSLSNKKNPHSFIKSKVYPILSLAYAFVALSFWIFVLYNANLTFITTRVTHSILSQLIVGWSLLGLLFWVPFFRKNYALSFIHSTPFFMLPLTFLIKNVYNYGILEASDVMNMGRLYLASILIYTAVIALFLMTQFIFLGLTSLRHHHHQL